MLRLSRKPLTLGVFAIAGVGVIGVGIDATSSPGGTAQAQVAPTASAFVPIDSFRAVDSRSSSVLGRLEVSESVTIIADEDTAGDQVIPDEATAVTFNITAVDTRGRGFLQVTTGNRELGNTSTLNWRRDGEVIANSGVTALFESTTAANENLENSFAVFINGTAGSSSHLVIDITGYYVPVSA